MSEAADGRGGAPPSPAPRQRSDRATLALVVGASLVSAGLGAYEIAPASVTPLVRESLGVGAAAAGLLVGVLFGTAVVTSLPVGVALDRTDSRVAMAVAVGGLLVAGAWGWWAGVRGDYASLLASRVAGGLAYTVVWNAGIDVVSRAVAPRHRATAVGAFTASGPLGFALGHGLGPHVAAAWGWPAILLAFDGLAVVGLALFWPTSRGLGGSAGAAPTPAELGGVLRTPAVWLVGGLGFLGYALYLFVNSWGPSYLVEVVGLPLATSGLVVAAFPAVGIASRVGGGLLSDRLFGGRRRPVVLAAFAVAAPLVAGFTALPTVAALVAALLVAGLAIQLMLGLSYAYVRELVDPRVAATAVAFQTSVGLAGGFLAPIAGGAVVDGLGYGAAFVGAGALAVAGVVLAWFAPEPG